MKNEKDHLHILELKYGIKYNAAFKDRIFRCIDPDCFYYTNAGMLLGKRFKCPGCLNDYVADRTALMKKKPHCMFCTKGKKAKTAVMELETMENRLSSILGLGAKREKE